MSRRADLALYTCPKPFEGHVGDIQTNALRSWTALEGSPELLVLGEDPGVAGIADELGIRHVPDVETNDQGTPLVDSLFARAREAASHEQLCYVNADIVLPEAFATTLTELREHAPEALVVGRRVNVDVRGRLDFADGWPAELEAKVEAESELDYPDAIDYFAYPADTFGEIPPFGIGRFGWDNWLLHRARERGHAIVDASPATTVVHQRHDYRDADDEARQREIRENRRLVTADADDADEIDRLRRMLTIADADHRYTGEGLEANRSLRRAWRGLLDLSQRYPVLRPLVHLARKVRHATRSRPSRAPDR